MRQNKITLGEQLLAILALIWAFVISDGRIVVSF